VTGPRSATPAAVAFYCPFCGEQDTRPVDPRGYRCGVCDRHWDVSLLEVGGGATDEEAER
jgi:transposase-like protein